MKLNVNVQEMLKIFEGELKFICFKKMNLRMLLTLMLLEIMMLLLICMLICIGWIRMYFKFANDLLFFK